MVLTITHLEKNHISAVYNVTANLWSHFTVRVMLFPTINVVCFAISTFQRCAQCPVWLFSVALYVVVSRYGAYRYFLDDSETVQVSPIITGITFFFYNSHAISFYCKFFIF